MTELKIEEPAALAFAEDDVKRAAAGNAQVLSDLRARLPGLGLEVRDGRDLLRTWSP
jgi:hypothetical protein